MGSERGATTGMKLVLFGDMHLDQAFAWLGSNRTAARTRRKSLRETFLKVLKLAAEEQADALLCSGDLYEQDRVTPDTGEFLRRSFGDLSPMKVFIAPGNHDYLSPGSIYKSTQWSDNVHIFHGDFSEGMVELGPGFVLWGTAHRVPANTPNFFAGFRVPSGPDTHVALAHASEAGWLQQASGQQPHAVFSAGDIERAGFTHALLGHIHTPKDHELFTYPGNPEPLTFSETGERGAVVFSFAGGGSIARQRHVLSSTNVEVVLVDLTGCATQHDVQQAIDAQLDGHSGYLEVRLTGDVEPSVDITTSDLAPERDGVLALRYDTSRVKINYDLAALSVETSIRGQFLRDVMDDPDLEDAERRRIIITGLRAFEGRSDLEVL